MLPWSLLEAAWYSQENNTTDKHEIKSNQVLPASIGVVQGASVLSGRFIPPPTPNGYTRAADWASPAHKIWVKKHNNHCDVIVEMAPDPTVYLFQVWIFHLSLFCCYFQSSFYQPSSTSLQKLRGKEHVLK